MPLLSPAEEEAERRRLEGTDAFAELVAISSRGAGAAAAGCGPVAIAPPAAPGAGLKKPPWLRQRAPQGDRRVANNRANGRRPHLFLFFCGSVLLPHTTRPAPPPRYEYLKDSLRTLNLHTVCEEAQCPNIGECWNGDTGTATIMLLGDICTRGCRFCAVNTARTPPPADPDEPENTAKAIAAWGLGRAAPPPPAGDARVQAGFSAGSDSDSDSDSIIRDPGTWSSPAWTGTTCRTAARSTLPRRRGGGGPPGGGPHATGRAAAAGAALSRPPKPARHPLFRPAGAHAQGTAAADAGGVPDARLPRGHGRSAPPGLPASRPPGLPAARQPPGPRSRLTSSSPAPQVRHLASSGLDVFAHNVETVARLQGRVRDARAGYEQSLSVLRTAKEAGVLTKSSLMLGLGEEDHEVLQAMRDIKARRRAAAGRGAARGRGKGDWACAGPRGCAGKSDGGTARRRRRGWTCSRSGSTCSRRTSTCL